MNTGRSITGVFRRLTNSVARGITAGRGRFSVIIDSSMILLTPLTLWIIAAVYVPVEGTGFTGFQPWGITAVILSFMYISLSLHSLAHIAVAGNSRAKIIYLSPLGDPAQSQPAELTTGREALTALAGPLVQCVLAGVFYLLWDLQINAFINVVTPFLIFFNLGLAAINLAPVFPFDGGRIMRATIWKLVGHPGASTKLGGRLGWGFCAGLAAWSVFLFAQHDRSSAETAGATLFVAILTVISLAFHPTRPWEKPEPDARINKYSLALRITAAVLLILPLAAVTLSLLPLNQGLEAPGFTASVEPMVQLPAEYRHDSAGSLILLTVIPQAPIIAGEWAYAHFDHTIRLMPPEQIIPEDKTQQSVSAEDYRMLLDSETTAIIVGLRLAGFPAEVNNAGVLVISILTESPARTILQPVDIITGVNGVPVITPTDLTSKMGQLTVQTTLKIDILRDGKALSLEVPTMDPVDGAVKIGITIEQYSSGYTLPFPVKIVAEKVSGGPSAGLMFTLGVYDLLTEKDLTGGRKIAGTGTIDLEGNVGPIGGVQQKVAAAERAGAEYFFSPEGNYDDALAAATHIKVIKVTTAQEAINFLQNL
jgi:Lon-like protease